MSIVYNKKVKKEYLYENVYVYNIDSFKHIISENIMLIFGMDGKQKQSIGDSTEDYIKSLFVDANILAYRTNNFGSIKRYTIYSLAPINKNYISFCNKFKYFIFLKKNMVDFLFDDDHTYKYRLENENSLIVSKVKEKIRMDKIDYILKNC